MTTENIFSADQAPVTPPVVPAPAAPEAPAIPQELTEYVGQGKKYASLTEVYKAFPHSQQHISTLEADNARMKEELARRKTAEELLQDIQNGIGTTQSQATPAPQVAPLPDISSIVRQEMEHARLVDEAKQNQSVVVSEFTKKFGDKAKTQFEQIAKDLGIPVDELNKLAAKSPKAVMKLAGIAEPMAPTRSGTLQSDINTQALSQIQQPSDNIRVSLNGSAKDDAAAMRKARELIMKQYQ